MDTIKRDMIIEIAKAFYITSLKIDDRGNANVANPISCFQCAELWVDAQIQYCKDNVDESVVS